MTDIPAEEIDFDMKHLTELERKSDD